MKNKPISFLYWLNASILPGVLLWATTPGLQAKTVTITQTVAVSPVQTGPESGYASQTNQTADTDRLSYTFGDTRSPIKRTITAHVSLPAGYTQADADNAARVAFAEQVAAHPEFVMECVILILIIVVATIIIVKLIQFCEKYLPPNPTNAVPTNQPPDITALFALQDGSYPPSSDASSSVKGTASPQYAIPPNTTIIEADMHADIWLSNGTAMMQMSAAMMIPLSQQVSVTNDTGWLGSWGFTNTNSLVAGSSSYAYNGVPIASTTNISFNFSTGELTVTPLGLTGPTATVGIMLQRGIPSMTGMTWTTISGVIWVTIGTNKTTVVLDDDGMPQSPQIYYRGVLVPQQQ